MNLFDALYYRYYLVYSKKWLLDESPHLNTIFSLSILESLSLNFGTEFVSTTYFCTHFSNKLMILIWALISTANYLVYGYMGKGKKVIKLKPKILGSDKLTLWVSIFFFLFSVSFIFWMPAYTRKVLEHCS